MYQYSVFDYCAMVKDEVRVAAYRTALERVVTKDSVVLDLGAGIGLFSIMAAQIGAARVYAVELNDAIDVGRELAKDAGVLDRITFLKKSIWDLEPPEKVDVMFYDLRGTTPLFEDNFRIVSAAKARWLKPNGVLLPAKDTLRACVVSAADVHESLASAWRAVRSMNIPYALVAKMIANARTSDRGHDITDDDMLTASFAFGDLRYGEPPPESITGTSTLNVTKNGRARGICVWFETELIEGVQFDTAPGTRPTYARAFLPFETEVDLEEGDAVTISVTAVITGTEWAWSITKHGKNGEIATFPRQSTFFSHPLSMESFLREAPAATPALSQKGELHARMLAAFDGKSSLADLAKRFAEDDAPASRAHALDELKALARKYAR